MFQLFSVNQILFVLLLFRFAIFPATEAVADIGGANRAEALFFGEESARSDGSGLWKWAKGRKMRFLVLARKRGAVTLSVIEDRNNEFVNLLAQTIYPAHNELIDVVDIKYNKPGNILVYFHSDLKDALSRQYEMFEGGKDLFLGWPKWENVTKRISNKDINYCIYRFSFNKSEIYGAIILIDARAKEEKQKSCLRAALYISLGAKYISPEMPEAQSDSFLNTISQIYGQKLSPGTSRDEFIQHFKP